jgi:uncharacterized protein DUF6653
MPIRGVSTPGLRPFRPWCWPSGAAPGSAGGAWFRWPWSSSGCGSTPQVFPPVDKPTRWASKGIYSEKIWARQRNAVPRHHRTAFGLIAIPGLAGVALLGWGLIMLEVWPTIFGTTLIVLAQLWRIDRLVWMYDELHGPTNDVEPGPHHAEHRPFLGQDDDQRPNISPAP